MITLVRKERAGAPHGTPLMTPLHNARPWSLLPLPARARAARGRGARRAPTAAPAAPTAGAPRPGAPRPDPPLDAAGAIRKYYSGYGAARSSVARAKAAADGVEAQLAVAGACLSRCAPLHGPACGCAHVTRGTFAEHGAGLVTVATVRREPKHTRARGSVRPGHTETVAARQTLERVHVTGHTAALQRPVALGGLPPRGGAQGSVTQGSVDQGSVAQGSVTQGSVTQGSVTQGSVTQGSVTQGSVAQGSVDQGSVAQGSVAQGSVAQGFETMPTAAGRMQRS